MFCRPRLLIAKLQVRVAARGGEWVGKGKEVVAPAKGRQSLSSVEFILWLGEDNVLLSLCISLPVFLPICLTFFPGISLFALFFLSFLVDFIKLELALLLLSLTVSKFLILSCSFSSLLVNSLILHPLLHLFYSSSTFPLSTSLSSFCLYFLSLFLSSLPFLSFTPSFSFFLTIHSLTEL